MLQVRPGGWLDVVATVFGRQYLTPVKPKVKLTAPVQNLEMLRLLRFAAKQQEPVDWPLELGSITLRRVSSELQSPATPNALHIDVIEVLLFVVLDRQV